MQLQMQGKVQQLASQLRQRPVDYRQHLGDLTMGIEVREVIQLRGYVLDYSGRYSVIMKRCSVPILGTAPFI